MPRFRYGAGLPKEQAESLLLSVESLDSRLWTRYWALTGDSFVGKNTRAACMSYIMGSFPLEDADWKREIQNKKRETFKKWCAEVHFEFEEKFHRAKTGAFRYYIYRPKKVSQKAPLLLFINGLEGSAEEIGFIMEPFKNEGIGFVLLSVPGTDDYDGPMTTDSENLFTSLLDELSQLEWVDSTKIGMVGFSFGAFWTLITAKIDSRIRFSLCNGTPLAHTFNPFRGFGLNPVLSLAITKIFQVPHPFYLFGTLRQLTRKAQKLMSKPSGPLLAINGDSDSIVDPQDTIDLGKASENHHLMMIPHDDHCALFHFPRMISIIVGWSKRNLEGPSTQVMREISSQK